MAAHLLVPLIITHDPLQHLQGLGPILNLFLPSSTKRHRNDWLVIMILLSFFIILLTTLLRS